MRAAAAKAVQPAVVATRQQHCTPAAAAAPQQQRHERPWQQQRRRRPLAAAAAGGGEQRVFAAGRDVGDEFEEMMDRREALLRQRDEEGEEGGLNTDEDEELADLTERAAPLLYLGGRFAVSSSPPAVCTYYSKGCRCMRWMLHPSTCATPLQLPRKDAPRPQPCSPLSLPSAAAAPQACCNLGTSRTLGRSLMTRMRRRRRATRMWRPYSWRTRMRRRRKRRAQRCGWMDGWMDG